MVLNVKTRSYKMTPLSTDLIRELNQSKTCLDPTQDLNPKILAASSSRTPVKTSRIQQSLQGTPNETKIRQLEAKLAGIYILTQLYPNM